MALNPRPARINSGLSRPNNPRSKARLPKMKIVQPEASRMRQDIFPISLLYLQNSPVGSPSLREFNIYLRGEFNHGPANPKIHPCRFRPRYASLAARP